MNKLFGKKVLVTAGPTYEPIDPVRFIGNYSSGKMGYSIAEAFAGVGASVTLISGPTSLSPSPFIKNFIKVKTSDEMYSHCMTHFLDNDIAVLSAAVADYKAPTLVKEKIKSSELTLGINLVKTVDIASELGKIKSDRQLLIGFALETENEVDNAKAKMNKKNFDLIVLNSLKDKGAGFGHDTNKITIIDTNNKIHKFGLKSKDQVAWDILEAIAEKLL